MTQRIQLAIGASFLALICLASQAVAQSSDDRLENVRLTLVNGSSIKVSIDRIGPDGLITGQHLPDDLKFDQITEIDTGNKQIAAAKSGIVIHMVDGGIIYCDEVTTNKDRLIAESSKSPQEFPLEVVRAILWQTDNQIQRLIQQPSTDDDSVVVQTSSGQQTVNGVLESIDRTHVRIKFEGESKKISRSIVQAVVTADLKLKPPAGPGVTATLIDGSIIVGTLNSFESGILKLNLSGNQVVDLKIKDLSRIVVASDRVVYLSDLDPVEVEQSSQFAAPRPWHRDASVAGNPMQLKFTSTGKIVSFAKGLGTKPYTLLAFENNHDYDQFRALVGIDWEMSGRGDCEMVVRGDGIQLWAKRIRGTDDPESLVIDITGMKKISLIVQPGESFDLSDHADWADARFMKSK